MDRQRMLLAPTAALAILISCHLAAGAEVSHFSLQDENTWAFEAEGLKYDHHDITNSPLLFNAFDSEDTSTELRQDFQNDVRFLLWTRDNKDHDAYDVLRNNDDNSVKNSNFDGDRPTVFIAHGWSVSGTTGWILKAKTEYLKFQDCNFISIDWEKPAGGWYYTVARTTPKVAKFAAEFIDFLHDDHGLDNSGVYLAGHSIGAHLVGIMGSYLNHRPVPRITGLDPAGPGFYTAPGDKIVDKTDATFVDIVHTSAGMYFPYLGRGGSVGHVDFYPNGGLYQRGCFKLFCSHSRAHVYWTESINGKTPFKAVPCPDRNSFYQGKCRDCRQGCLNMGIHAATHLRGDYYLRTNFRAPYATGRLY